MFTATEPVQVDYSGVRTGGTLRLGGPGDPSALDPAGVDDAASAQLVRLYSRQLFAYRADPDLRSWQATAPVPDLATQIPSIYNAGLGASGTTYVVHLRPGVRWDTDPPRPVTAHDVIRGMKRLANPVRPPAVLPYFTSTIRGMAQYHADLLAALGDRPTAQELADFQNGHEIPGIFALDDESLVFELVRPTLDFISMLALPAVAPAPAEYDAYLPDSPQLRANLRANGPYRVAAYTAGRELVLTPNPVWRQETDPIRRGYLDRIEVSLGSTPDPVTLSRRVRAGRVDLLWGTRVAEPAAEPASGLGWHLDPYLLFNLRGERPVRDLAVRQAIAYAIDKVALAELVAQASSGTAVRVAGAVIPPGNDGHTGADPYATADGRSWPTRASELLAATGRADGLTLTAVHLDRPEPTAVAGSLAADLARVGIEVRLVALGPAEHRARLTDPAGDWDLSILSWAPAWSHGNARVFPQPLLQSAASAGTRNHGGYAEPEVDQLIEGALAQIDPRHAVSAWQDVERRALADLPIVPLLYQCPTGPAVCGPRVRDAVAMPTLGHDYDLSVVWLDPPD